MNDPDLDEQIRQAIVNADAMLRTASRDLEGFMRGELTNLKRPLEQATEARREIERAVVLSDRARAMELSG